MAYRPPPAIGPPRMGVVKGEVRERFEKGDNGKYDS